MQTQEHVHTAIIGTRGYTGAALLSLLKKHPILQPSILLVRKQSYDRMVGREANVHLLSEDYNIDCTDKADICFLATPPDVSMRLAPKLIAKGKTVIDLSPAFRLPAKQFEDVYAMEHLAPEQTGEAVYSLSPWCTEDIAGSRLIANPGCYASCILMALLPLLQAELINAEHIIIDAKSGASGAGRTPREEILFCEVSDNFFPYKVGCHQHVPEINRYIKQYAGKESDVILVTQMLPVLRGIAATIYAEPAKPVYDQLISDIGQAYRNAYAQYPLVRSVPVTHEQAGVMLQLRNSTHRPVTHIGYYAEKGRIIIFANIDNLLKGAASQAIEAANIALGQSPETGLLEEEIWQQ